VIYDQGSPRPGTEATRRHTGKKSIAVGIIVGFEGLILAMLIQDSHRGVGAPPPPISPLA